MRKPSPKALLIIAICIALVVFLLLIVPLHHNSLPKRYVQKEASKIEYKHKEDSQVPPVKPPIVPESFPAKTTASKTIGSRIRISKLEDELFGLDVRMRELQIRLNTLDQIELQLKEIQSNNEKSNTTEAFNGELLETWKQKNEVSMILSQVSSKKRLLSAELKWELSKLSPTKSTHEYISENTIDVSIDNLDNFTCSSSEPSGFWTRNILYATDRKSIKENGKIKGYSNDRNPHGLSYGEASITIPHSHIFGHVDDASKMDVLLRYVGPNYEMTIQNIQELQIKSFIAKAAEKTNGKDGSHALIFIHGFNNSFTEASLRAGQMAFDLGFSGPTILYSWASNGIYNSDIERSMYTIPRLTSFLTELLDCNKFKEVSIIAHSMGNRAMGGALTEIAKSRPNTKFNQIILAAPDIDEMTFEHNIAPIIQTAAKRFTVYSSKNDMALWASSKVNANNRLGLAHIPVAGFQFVDISSIKCDDMFAHSCYAEAYPVMADINSLLTFNADPGMRMLNPKEGYWAIKAAK